jgi:hypothetical protein
MYELQQDFITDSIKHAVITYGGVAVQLHHSMELTSELHAPVALTSFDRGLGGVLSRCGQYEGETKISCPCRESSLCRQSL